ncbi:hypothetical protein CEXT_283091 [Caerostris extrusa]|uniref:Uncharacterized protein n=1 Tax=Caerostris extrusa TaxID=172846 RepID=A0AAV4Y8H7_CAEEX|nr:hypothetical protein CEXT_283091 [Caerostris extrusa]
MTLKGSSAWGNALRPQSICSETRAAKNTELLSEIRPGRLEKNLLFQREDQSGSWRKETSPLRQSDQNLGESG